MVSVDIDDGAAEALAEEGERILDADVHAADVARQDEEVDAVRIEARHELPAMVAVVLEMQVAKGQDAHRRKGISVARGPDGSLAPW